MAIYFHEGLPGAGKSYEAIVHHIIPALREGRQVVTNLRGINTEKLAALVDQPEDYIKLLVIYIEPAEQDDDPAELEREKNSFANETPDNAMILWDEIQDYFPSGNYKLPPNQQKFWTQHRHRGLDIILMGQDRDDVHKIIRSRIEAITYFLKLKAVGKPDSYKWEHFEKQSKGKFIKIGAGVRHYEEKYFGTYMSHRREGTRSKVYTPARTNVLANSKALSLGVPVVFLVAIYGVYHLWGFFNPKPVQAKPQSVITTPAPPNVVTYSRAPAEPSLPAKSDPSPDPDEPPPPIDYFDRMAQQYLIRAGAVLTSSVPGRELMAHIELLDQTYKQKEVFSVIEIRAMGWTVTNHDYGILIEKQGVKYIARTWPLDINGRVDQRTQDGLSGTASASARGYGQSQTGATPVTVIANGELASRPWR